MWYVFVYYIIYCYIVKKYVGHFWCRFSFLSSSVYLLQLIMCRYHCVSLMETCGASRIILDNCTAMLDFMCMMGMSFCFFVHTVRQKSCLTKHFMVHIIHTSLQTLCVMSSYCIPLEMSTENEVLHVRPITFEFQKDIKMWAEAGPS